MAEAFDQEPKPRKTDGGEDGELRVRAYVGLLSEEGLFMKKSFSSLPVDEGKPCDLDN
jgi:hypothetical protein